MPRNLANLITWRLSLPPQPVLIGVLALLAALGMWHLEDRLRRYFSPPPTHTEVVGLFTPEVNYWGPQISAWATLYGLDPNLLATVMQIESCGHPTVSSYAGAQGLFQVMPFHFSDGEVMTDPNTNARRGAAVLSDCLRRAQDDVGLALACYNGGPRVISQDEALWNQQVKDYYYWGTGIYADVLNGKAESERLNEWLDAGGRRLCNQAALVIGLP